jgi:hypothetical protein
LLTIGAILVGCALPTLADEVSALSNPIEYSLLMPAVANKYFVYTVNDAMNLIALGGHTNSVRASALDTLVRKEGYDAGLVLASVLQEQLDEAGYRTELEHIPRAKLGQPQHLSRGDLPRNPQGEYLLDVVIESIGLANVSNGGEWMPAFEMKWRVMRPSGDILVPTHIFVYGPFVDANGIEYNRSTCGLPSFGKSMEKPPVLWDCFDHGLREASRALIPVIREQQDIALHGRHPTSSESAAATATTCVKARRPRDILDGTCSAK